MRQLRCPRLPPPSGPAPAAATASTTVVEAESLQWPDGSGRLYADGYQAWTNAWRVGSRLFSLSSRRNLPLAPDAPLDPDQSAVGRLQKQLALHPAWLNTREWSAPIYVASANQPRRRVQVETDYEHDLWRDWGDVPLVSDAMGAPPADGYDDRDSLFLRMSKRHWTDRSLVVYQPATDSLWEFIHLVKRGGSFYAADGGNITNVSENLGSWDPWPSGLPHSTTGAGLPHMIGMSACARPPRAATATATRRSIRMRSRRGRASACPPR